MLHGLRLKGVAEPATVAEAVDLPEPDVEALLKDAAGRGFAEHRDGLPPRAGRSRAAGRSEHERLLAAEAEAEHAVAAIEDAYGRFRRLNPRRARRLQPLAGPRRGRPAGPQRPPRRAPTTGPSSATSPALARRAGRCATGWATRSSATGPTAPGSATPSSGSGPATRLVHQAGRSPSFHTVWFELHEDLLATLGLDRSDEADSADRQGTT